MEDAENTKNKEDNELARWLPAAMVGLAITATAVLATIWLCHRRLHGRSKSGVYATGASTLGSVGSASYGRRGRRGGRWPPAHFMRPGPPVILGYEAEADSKLVEERRRTEKSRRQQRRWLIMPSSTSPETAAAVAAAAASSSQPPPVLSSFKVEEDDNEKNNFSSTVEHVVNEEGHKVTEL